MIEKITNTYPSIIIGQNKLVNQAFFDNYF